MFEECHDTQGRAFEIASANRPALEGHLDARGRRIAIVTITDAPRDRARDGKGDRGYSNSSIYFYVANGGVVMPCFGLETDAAAKAAVEAAFPDREVVQVDISTLAAGGGGIHCITQQQPAASGPSVQPTGETP